MLWFRNNTNCFLINSTFEYTLNCRNRPLETEIAPKSRKSQNRHHNAQNRPLGSDFAHDEDQWTSGLVKYRFNFGLVTGTWQHLVGEICYTVGTSQSPSTELIGGGYPARISKLGPEGAVRGMTELETLHMLFDMLDTIRWYFVDVLLGICILPLSREQGPMSFLQKAHTIICAGFARKWFRSKLPKTVEKVAVIELQFHWYHEADSKGTDHQLRWVQLVLRLVIFYDVQKNNEESTLPNALRCARHLLPATSNQHRSSYYVGGS